jgi:fatty-acyl-CoA synthase
MPLFHGNALLANLFPAAVKGASVVLRRRFSASAFLPDVRRHGCTYFNYVGRALSYILAQPEAPDDADNQLKWGLGSEASPRDVEEFRRRFGCYVVEGYGSSEGAVVIQPFPGMPPEALGRPKEGQTSGCTIPTPGRSARGPASTRTVELLNAAEAIGEIVGRDVLSSFEGYYANPEADAERSRNGWYWTGDLGYRDDDGTFYFAGRTADWLRVDGENFAAGPVERILGGSPAWRRGRLRRARSAHRRPGDGGPRARRRCRLRPGRLRSFLAASPTSAPSGRRASSASSTRPTHRHAQGRPQAAAPPSAGTTTDPVWWRPTAAEPYRLLDAADIDALHRAFEAAGRAGMLT